MCYFTKKIYKSLTSRFSRDSDASTLRDADGSSKKLKQERSKDALKNSKNSSAASPNPSDRQH